MATRISYQDLRVLTSIQQNSLLQPALPMLSAIWKQRRQELEQEEMKPYGELLLAYLKPVFIQKTEEIQESLLTVAKTARNYTELEIPIWSFNSIAWNESFKSFNTRLHAASAGEKTEILEDKRADDKAIDKNGWNNRIGLLAKPQEEEGELMTWYRLRPRAIYQIIKKTDVLKRINLLFGNCFSVKLKSRCVKGTPRFRVTQNEIILSYFPEGVPPHKLKELIETAKQSTEDTLQLMKGEQIQFLDGTEEQPEGFIQGRGCIPVNLDETDSTHAAAYECPPSPPMGGCGCCRFAGAESPIEISNIFPVSQEIYDSDWSGKE